MKIVDKISKQIGSDDYYIALASQKLQLLRKLRSIFPHKNIIILSSINANSLEDKSMWVLVVPKRRSKQLNKDGWKKAVFY